MKIGDVLSLALLGALGYAGYMLYSGKWKFPNPFESITEFLDPSNVTLAERTKELIETGGAQKLIIDETGLKPDLITPNMVREKAEVQAGAEQYMSLFGGGFPVIAQLWATGLGLGLGKQQEEYLSTLPQLAKERAQFEEYYRRQAFLDTPQGTIANLLGFGIPNLLTQTVWAPDVSEPTKEKLQTAYLTEMSATNIKTQITKGDIKSVGDIIKHEQKARETAIREVIYQEVGNLGQKPTKDNTKLYKETFKEKTIAKPELAVKLIETNLFRGLR